MYVVGGRKKRRGVYIVGAGFSLLESSKKRFKFLRFQPVSFCLVAKNKVRKRIDLKLLGFFGLCI